MMNKLPNVNYYDVVADLEALIELLENENKAGLNKYKNVYPMEALKLLRKRYSNDQR